MAKWVQICVLALFCLLVLINHCFAFRMKRRLDSFGEMIELKTSRNPLDFNDYGNWCGFGGKGNPVDAIDACCKVHDMCYSHINRDECETIQRYEKYTTKYKWSYHADVITCAEEDPCAKKLCECDREAATCFGETEGVYDKANKHGIIKGISKLFGLNG